MSIGQCNCVSDRFGNKKGVLHQEKILGKGFRYFTSGPKPYCKKVRCTVCSSEKPNKDDTSSTE